MMRLIVSVLGLALFLLWFFVTALVGGIDYGANFVVSFAKPATIHGITPATYTVDYRYTVKADGAIWVANLSGGRIAITSLETNRQVKFSLRALRLKTDFWGNQTYEKKKNGEIDPASEPMIKKEVLISNPNVRFRR